MPNPETYRRADGRFAWRLRADNGAIIATDGGQGYEKRADCERMADAVTSGLYADDGCHAAERFDRIREQLPWWESPNRMHADGSILASAIRRIIDPPTEGDRG